MPAALRRKIGCEVLAMEGKFKLHSLRPVFFWGFQAVFWYYAAVLLDAQLKVRGFSGAYQVLITVLMTLGAALICAGAMRITLRRRRKARLEAQKAQAGALALLALPPQEALARVCRAKANEKGLCVREILPDVALIETPRGLLGFGLIALAKGSAAGTEALCALHRAAKAAGCQAVCAVSLFELSPGAGLFAQTLADPPVYLRDPARYAAIYASFAPDPLPRKARAALPTARRHGKKLFRTGALMILAALLLRPFFLPGLLLALFGVYLTIRGQEDGPSWPL